MVKQFLQFVYENALLEDGDHVLVAFSGGADSVCLLHTMLELKKQFDIEVDAVHVNHNLRGEEAQRDALFCKSVCDKLAVRLHMVSVPVAELAQKNKQSIETAAREARYVAFYALTKEYGYTKIAVAHNANDQAETILMHLLRGSGIDGLHGILPKRGKLIRPLLCVERSEIEAYLSERGLVCVTDSTNAEDVYLRNRIRHDLLPKLIQDYNPNFVKTMAQTAVLLQNDAQYLTMAAEQLEERIVFHSGSMYGIRTALLPTDKAIKLRVIKKAISLCIGKMQDIPFDTVLRCAELCENGQVGKSVDLPRGYTARLEQDGNLIMRKSDVTEQYCYCIDKVFPYELKLDNGTIYIEMTDCAGKDTADCVYFDYGKLSKPLYIRNRRQGDMLQLKGLDGTKKLKEYFIDEKIPKHLRDGWPLLCTENTLLWICGKRKCKGYDVDENTKQVIKCNFRGDRHEI